MRVADFIDETAACWKVEKLQQFFLPMDIEIIRRIPLSTRRHDDFWSWKHREAWLNDTGNKL
jgi:hypothetical protein